MSMSYNFAFFDEGSKREIRRAILKAIAIPGYQVPFASQEMPIARGWGTGGLQITLSLIGKKDVLKVIDQGSDESVNAVSIKKLVVETTGVAITDDANEASIIQSRHRIPEYEMKSGQVLVLQVPIAEPLRTFESREYVTKRLHADGEYTGAWLTLFDQIMRYGHVTSGAEHPVVVADRYLMTPSPIPRFDNPKMHQNEGLILLGAGREKKIFAISPYTNVKSIDFDDCPFAVETFTNKCCSLCGATNVFLDEVVIDGDVATYQCNDTSYCQQRRNDKI